MEITNPVILGEAVKDKEYLAVRPVVNVGFLDYTLFEENPEFYACYKLINVKNHIKYSDGLTLYVVDLSRIDLASDEDKQYHIHEWAALFKAVTWEEMKILASKNEYLREASETIFRLSAEEIVRKRCRDREEYYQDMRSYERKIEQDRREYEEDKKSYENKIEQNRREYEQTVSEMDQTIFRQAAEIERLREELARLGHLNTVSD